MRKLTTYSVALAALAIVLAASAFAAPQRHAQIASPKSHAPPHRVAERAVESSWHHARVLRQRHAIQWLRRKTTSLYDRAGVPRPRTGHAEWGTRSLPFLHWIHDKGILRHDAARRLFLSHSGTVPQIIVRIFGANSPMALRVAERESGYCTCAANGQYLGIFQMGSNERARFATIGYSTAYEQVVAAHNYFLVSGWSPWSQTAY